MTNHPNVKQAENIYFFHDILLKTKGVDVRQFLTAMFLSISFGATAGHWVVGDICGIDYSERNNFRPEEDGFSGTLITKANGEDASITYSGADTGSMVYRALSKNSIIGIGTSGKTQRVIDPWVIHPTETISMSKIISGCGNMGSIKAFVGKVKRER